MKELIECAHCRCPIDDEDQAEARKFVETVEAEEGRRDKLLWAFRRWRAKTHPEPFATETREDPEWDAEVTVRRFKLCCACWHYFDTEDQR